MVLIDRGIRGLFNYYQNNFSSFQYNPQSDNLVWCIRDGKLLYFNDFESVRGKNKGDDCVFKMQELVLENNNYATVKKALNEL